MANVLKGEGTILAYSADGTTYTTIAQRVTISGPKMEVAEVETSDLDSTVKTFRPSGVPDSGSLDLEVYFDPDDTQHTAIRALMATPAVKNFKLTLTDGTPATATFAGFPTSFELNGMEIEGNLGANVSIKITGAITWA